MKYNLPKRYVTEASVKKALKIDSFRNLSKDKIMQFASMIPYMDKDVAIAIINQFPVFADFGKTAISCFAEMNRSVLERNNESQKAVLLGYQTILEALSHKMSQENITEEQRKSITEDMIAVADKIAEADLENKKFLDKVGTKVLCGICLVAGLVGAGIGINTAMSNSGEIPQIDEDKDED